VLTISTNLLPAKEIFRGIKMIKYFQVFISSASVGMSEIRKEIINKLIAQDRFFPIAMEYMNADDNTLLMLYNYMKRSDICLLLLGDSAGSKIGSASRYITDPELLAAINEYKEISGLRSIEELTYTEFEYAAALYLGVRIVPFVKKSLVDAFEKGTLEETAARFYSAVREKAVYQNWTDVLNPEQVVTSLNRCVDSHPDLAGWIREKDSSIYRSAKNAGICDVSLQGFLPKDKLKGWLSSADRLMLCYTTGNAFAAGNRDLLADFVSMGGNIQLLCCKPYTKEMYDIQKLEETEHGNREQIHRELFEVYNLLQNVYSKACEKYERGEGREPGKFQIGFMSTLFRSSFLIASSSENSKKVGWFTVTLPPAKSRETVTFEIESDAAVSAQNNLLSRCSEHFEHVWNYSASKGEVITIGRATSLEIEKESDGSKVDEKYWKEREQAAALNMRRRKRNKNILIEVAAQHPLKDGLYPDEEFTARLDRAIELYKEKTAEGYGVKLYVPGSLHLDFDGVPDEVSLSEAGTTYLKEMGIPEDRLFGNEMNNLYDGERHHEGVYNTADECFIASKIFFTEEESFGLLYSVCSPNQLMRKNLFYMEFGIIPMIITVPTANMFHNFLKELLGNVPYILSEDHNYQGKTSKEAIRTRRERLPDYEKK